MGRSCIVLQASHTATQLNSVSGSWEKRDHRWPSERRSLFRNILVSVKFLSAILGPEMGAPILWTPGKMRPFYRKNHVHKMPRFYGGGGILGFGGGGGSADFIFMGARIFLNSACALPQVGHRRNLCRVRWVVVFSRSRIGQARPRH